MENQSLSILITKKKYLLLAILFLLLISSCTKKNEIMQEDISAKEEDEKIINRYKGLWKCESSDVFQELLDLGLVLELGIYTDGKFNILATIGEEQQILNTGTWSLLSDKDKAMFVLPDQEYGGTITGTFELKDKKIYYILDEHPEEASIFVKY